MVKFQQTNNAVSIFFQLREILCLHKQNSMFKQDIYQSN